MSWLKIYQAETLPSYLLDEGRADMLQEAPMYTSEGGAVPSISPSDQSSPTVAPTGSAPSTELEFSDEQLEVFETRLEEGYDIYEDDEYV